MICHKCGRDNFKRIDGMTNHIKSCSGVRHLNKMNLSAKRQKLDHDDTHLGMMDEERLLRHAVHSDCISDKFSFVHKKSNNYFASASAKLEGTNSSSSSSSSSSSEESINDDDCSLGGGNDDISYDSDNGEVGTGVFDPRKKPAKEASPPFAKTAGITSASMFSIDLADILGRHRTDLSLHNEIIDLVQSHSNNNKLKFYSESLKHRAGFLSDLEDILKTKRLKPKDETVKLTDGTKVTVPVFDVEAMIMSLLQDEELMQEENLAPGYDIHTGKPTEEVTHYGEVHTGDAWEPARKHFCGVHHDNNQNMPIALIIFGDKSHFDLHGTLSTTPLIFTLSCFNQRARNLARFWRPIAYIPNLSHSKVSYKQNNKEEEAANVQDEHNCLSVALQKLIDITIDGGIAMKVKGKTVIGKVWIHYVIGEDRKSVV